MPGETEQMAAACTTVTSPHGVEMMDHVFTGNGTCVCGGAGLMRFSDEGDVTMYEDRPSAPPMHRIRQLVTFVEALRHEEAEARDVKMRAEESWAVAHRRLESARKLEDRLLAEICKGLR